MADLEGTWTPEDQDEMGFITNLNSLVREAHERGVEVDEIVSGLSFMASTLAMAGDELPEPEQVDVPALDDKPEKCPACGNPIEDVRAFIGGECVVEPCTCHVDQTRLGEWVEDPTGDGDV